MQTDGGNPGQYRGESPGGEEGRQDDPTNVNDRSCNRRSREMGRSLPDWRMQLAFLTLRRRSKTIMAALRARPEADWRRIRLANIGHPPLPPAANHRRDHPPLAQYPGQIRQIAITGLGHDDPVLLVTNQMRARPADLVDRYARRMVIENQIAETIVPWLEGRALKLEFGTRNPSSVIPPPSVGIQASSLTTHIITGRPFGLSEMQSSGSKRIPWGRDRRQNVIYSASA